VVAIGPGTGSPETHTHTLFLSVSQANAFTSLSLVVGNQVRFNHLICLQQTMSNDPRNEPSCEPIGKLTKRLEQDALLPGNLSLKGVTTETQFCGLCHDKKSEQVMFCNQEQDNEILSKRHDSSNTQPSHWQGPNKEVS
jgi:hypothetical protein